jgi:hypothetical protein
MVCSGGVVGTSGAIAPDALCRYGASDWPDAHEAGAPAGISPAVCRLRRALLRHASCEAVALAAFPIFHFRL